MLCVCVNFKLNCSRSVECLVFVGEMADRMEDDVAGVKLVSGEFRERDEKSNVIFRERPRRHIRPLQQYIKEEWVPLKPRQITVGEETLEKRSSSGCSGQQSNKSSASSKLSSHTNSGSGSSSKSSKLRRKLRLHEPKLLHVKREAEVRESEEKGQAEEDLRRREEERRLRELRRIRELEYEAERLRLQAR